MSSSRLTRRGFAHVCAGGLAAASIAATRRARAELPPPGSPTLRGILAAGKVRIGMCPGFAPFVVAGPELDGFLSFAGADRPSPRQAADGRQVAGLDVDLAAEVAQALGVGLELRLVARFDEMFELLGRSEVEAAISGITRTLPRARSLSFSQPYLVSGQEVYVIDAARFVSLDAVSKPGVRVGAKQGTTGEAFARESLAAASLVGYPNSDALFTALDARAIDAAVADGLVGRDMILRKKVRAPLVSVERRRVTSESIAIAVRQGDTDWTDYVSLVLRESRSAGRFHRMARRYNAWLRAER